ncbi:MAG: LegC family aminotransferase [Raineya sp.]|nr:LegC family aminotransferase [Raineya sp.]
MEHFEIPTIRFLEKTQNQDFQIPLLAPFVTGKEEIYLKKCLQSGWITTTGEFVEAFERKIQDYTQSSYVVAVSSGTAALHLALKAVGVSENSLVILPNISFVASANAIHYCQAEPIFVDISPDTWQLDEQLLLKFLQNECYSKGKHTFHKATQKRISALVLVHNLGNIGNLTEIQKIAENFNIPLVEDAAEALGSFYHQKHAGICSKVGILSFNGNKIVTTGGGGAILTADEKIAQKVRHWANQAKTSKEEYFHDEVGYNYRLPNPLAAIGLAQMESLDFFLARKRYIYNFYTNILFGKAIWQRTLESVEPNYWLFTALFENSSQIAQKLQDKGIQTRKLWYPLNRLPMHKKCLYVQENDISWEIYEKSLSLPSSVGLQENEMEKIAEILQKI